MRVYELAGERDQLPPATTPQGYIPALHPSMTGTRLVKMLVGCH